MIAAGAATGVEAVIAVEEVEVVAEEAAVHPKFSYNPTDYPGSSLPEAHKIAWSPKTWSPDNPFTTKNVSRSRSTARKCSTVYGTPTDPRLPLQW